MQEFDGLSWRTIVASLAADAKFAKPATETQLAALEQTLGVYLPGELRQLLLEFDGLIADFGADVVWSVEQIEQQNQKFRTEESFRDLYMPFHHLLFFGEDGGGDQFAFPIQADGEIHNPDIFRWEHESDARSWYAKGLKQYFERRFPRGSEPVRQMES